VTAPTGRREANKQATRAALAAAAKRLFAERGYQATTVRDIARAAKVTERTFYRYFDGKEGLIAHEYLSWLAILQDAVRARPGDEPPLTAARRAMISVARQAGAEDGPAPLWLLRDRPLAGLRQSAPRPLLRFEASIADAILSRRAAGATDDNPADPGEEFRAQVIARVAVAALRSALIRHRELLTRGEAASHSVEQLLDRAFAVIGDQESGRNRQRPARVHRAAQLPRWLISTGRPSGSSADGSVERHRLLDVAGEQHKGGDLSHAAFLPFAGRRTNGAGGRLSAGVVDRRGVSALQRGVVEVGQDVPGEQVAFGGVRVAGQDERLHAEAGVAAQLGEDLAGVADDGGASAGARAADPRPQIRLGVAVVVGHVA
jgi:AcrR family transcriptional regulator